MRKKLVQKENKSPAWVVEGGREAVLAGLLQRDGLRVVSLRGLLIA